MKKYIVFLIIFSALLSGAYAADLKFEPDGGGKFIYCNNNEFIRREHLADNSNPKPEYIMTCPDMKEGKYTLYFSHINHTELKNFTEYKDSSDVPENLSAEEKERYSKVYEKGFAIETDVRFKALEDITFKVTALGFEVQPKHNYYYTNRLINYEDSWGCLNAVSDYFQKPILTAGSEYNYQPHKFSEKEITLKKGEVFWLSKIIDNYSAAAWLRPVHLLCDFEILSGSAEINIAAMRSRKLGDRSNVAENPAPGRYYRDGQYKGISPSLPSVTAELEYEIDDSLADGDELPVTVYNQYVKEGTEVKNWHTHINPQNDAKVRRSAAESDMLPIYYEDGEKLGLYSEDIPESERDSVWKFDVYHSDTRLGGNPNYELNTSKYNVKKAANLANYCVNTNYKLKITNSGEKDRYFAYRAKCTSSIITHITKANGESEPNLTAKFYRNSSEWDTLSKIKLGAGETTEFTLTVFLPINYVGGILNSFMITDDEPEIKFNEDLKETDVKEKTYSGGGFVAFDDLLGGEPGFITSGDRKKAVKIPVGDDTAKIFSKDKNAYKISLMGDYYFVYYNDFAETPAYYSNMTKYVSDVYVLDKNFKKVNTLKFNRSFPYMFSYAGGKYYIRSDKTYCSSDLENWETADYFDGGFSLPKDNGSGVILLPQTGGKTYLSPDGGENYYKISFSEGTKKPRYIDVAGRFYYYAEGTKLYTSYNGISWQEYDAEEKITAVSANSSGDEIIVNKKKRITPQKDKTGGAVIFGEVKVPEFETLENPSSILLAAEDALFGDGMSYSQSADGKTLRITFGGKKYELHAGSNILIIEGEKNRSYLENTCILKDGKFYVPLADLYSAMGYKCEYNEKSGYYVVK